MTAPSVASAWEMFHRGKLRQAEALARSIIERGEQNPQMFLLIGVVHTKLGSPHTALGYLEQSLRLGPRNFDAHNWLSFSNFKAGNFEEAHTQAELALAIRPGHADALNNLGLSLTGLRRYAEAVRAYEDSIKAAPAVATTYENLGSALLELGEYARAERAFTKCVSLNGDNENLRVLWARMHIANQNPAKAVEEARRAIAFNHHSAPAHLTLGTALRLSGDPDAIAVLEEAVQLSPDSAESYCELGAALQAAGKQTQAREALLKSLELQPSQGSAFFYLLATNKIEKDLTPRALHALSSESHSLGDRSMLSYAVGKGLENLGEYREAMFHFDQAKEIDHQLYRKGQPFDRQSFARMHQAIIEVWTRDRLHNLRPIGGGASQPVLVLGMMRSGTTLVDQIVSSHSQVRAAGERGFGFTTQYTISSICSGTLSSVEARAEAENYLRQLLKISGPTKYVTDKMPTNFMVLGLVSTLFPKAKILHVTRNPVDTALSIWTTPNGTPPPYSFNKADIVFAYREYHRIMRHWRKVLPPDAFLTIRYEDLIANQEHTVRKIIAYCGLDWEDACLSHEQSANLIATPSFWQARQPIYSSSVARWEKYRDDLGDLSELIGAEPPN